MAAGVVLPSSSILGGHSSPPVPFGSWSGCVAMGGSEREGFANLPN